MNMNIISDTDYWRCGHHLTTLHLACRVSWGLTLKGENQAFCSLTAVTDGFLYSPSTFIISLATFRLLYKTANKDFAGYLGRKKKNKGLKSFSHPADEQLYLANDQRASLLVRHKVKGRWTTFVTAITCQRHETWRWLMWMKRNQHSQWINYDHPVRNGIHCAQGTAGVWSVRKM